MGTRIVATAFGEHFRLGTQLLDQLTAVLNSLRAAELPVAYPVGIVTLGLMSKAIKIGRSVHALCGLALTDEAAPLVRSMIECLAHSFFLGRGEIERNARYMIAWDTIHKARHQEMHTRVPPEVGGLGVEMAPRAAQEFREEVRRWVTDVEATQIEGYVRQLRLWTGLRITEMVDRMGEFNRAYSVARILYSALSSPTHAADILRHVDVASEDARPKLAPEFTWAGAMVSHANDLALEIAETLGRLGSLYSDVTLTPLRAAKQEWDRLPMYAAKVDNWIVLLDFEGRVVGRISGSE